MANTQNRDNVVNRRDVLRVGSLYGLGVPTLAHWMDLQSRAKASERRGSFGAARQVIMLYLHGGHPQQETFDPKPEGPAEVRGEFSAIATDVPGVRFSECLPSTARLMSRLAVVRSMTHDNPNHVQASLPANTGHRHAPGGKSGDFPPSSSDFPPFGAVLSKLRQNRSDADSELPPWVRIGPLMRRSNGTVLHGQLPGLLGAGHSSFVVDQSLLKADVNIRALQSQQELPSLRLTDRFRLQQQFNQLADGLAGSAQVADLGKHYHRACDLLTAPKIRAAFRLADEKRTTRERYGLTEFGQRCLLARRLAESGVPMINVSYCHTPSGSWDTHGQNFKKMKGSLGPTLDRAFSALVSDLEQRGMLGETLVIVNAEFGRTPKINKNAGRDHWPFVYSLALAGAGIQTGAVHGKSDASAAYPERDPHGPADMAATIYHLLGVPSDTTIYDPSGRPSRLVIGRPIEAILRS